MKRLLVLLVGILVPIISYGQTRIRGNVYIVTGSDTVWINQDGVNAIFDATKPFKFNDALTGTSAGFSSYVTALSPSSGDNSTKLATTSWVRNYVSGGGGGGGITPSPADANKYLTTDGSSLRFTDSLLSEMKIPADIKLHFGGFAYTDLYYNSGTGAFEISGNSGVEILQNTTIQGDLQFYGSRTIGINGSSGEDLTIRPAGSLTGGQGGDVYIVPGTGLAGNNGNIWLASADGLAFTGYARTRTATAGDSSSIVATTAFVDRAVSAAPSTSPGGLTGQFQYNSSGTFAGSSVLSNGVGKLLITGDMEFYSTGPAVERKLYPTDYLSSGGTASSMLVRAANATGFASVGGALKLAGGSGSAAAGGNVYVYGGTGSTQGDTWIGYSDAGTTSIGNSYAKTQLASDDSKKIATTEFVHDIIPVMTGYNGRFLTTNGTVGSWAYVEDLYYSGSKKIDVTSTGATVTGLLYADNIVSNGYINSTGELGVSDTAYFSSLVSSPAYIDLVFSPSLGNTNQPKIIMNYGTPSAGGGINLDGGFGSGGNGSVYLGTRDDGANWTSDVFVKTQLSSDSSLRVASTAYVDNAIYGISAGAILPTQTGKQNMFLTTNGSAAQWNDSIKKDWFVKTNTKLYWGNSGQNYTTFDGVSLTDVTGAGIHWGAYTGGTGEPAIIAKADSTVWLNYDALPAARTMPGGMKMDSLEADKMVTTEYITILRSGSAGIKVENNTSGAGKEFSIDGSNGTGANNGGNILITAGATADGLGGNVQITGGNETGSGTIGSVLLGTRNGGASYDNYTYIKTVTDDSDSSNLAASTAFVQRLVTAGSALPNMSGHAGKFLTNNGGTANWADTVGVNLTFNDNKQLRLGTAGAEGAIYSNGSNPIFKANTSLYFISSTGENLTTMVPDGAVTLYYNNSAKLATSSGGISVTGNITMDNGGARSVGISSMTSGTGKNLTVAGGGSNSGNGGSLILTGGGGDPTTGSGGNVYMYGGSGAVGNDPSVWLGYSDAGTTPVGKVWAKTQPMSTDSRLLATTEFVHNLMDSTYEGDLLLANEDWLYSVTSIGDTAGVIRLSSSNTIQFGSTVEIGSLYTIPDAGLVTIANQSIPTLSYGSEAGYNIVVGGEEVLKMVVTADGTGGAIDSRVYATTFDASDSLVVGSGKMYINGSDLTLSSAGVIDLIDNTVVSGYINATSFILPPGLDREIYVDGVAGENLSIFAGAHLASGTAGSVYLYGGTSLGVNGDVYLGINSSSLEIGNVYTKTAALGDSTQIVANTAFVDRAISGIDYSGFLEYSDTISTIATKYDIAQLDEPSLVRFSDTSSVIATKYDIDTLNHFGESVYITGDLALTKGTDRQIYIDGATGENLSIFAGAHLASGTGGSVYIYGGTSLATNGNVWLGYNQALLPIGNVYSQTPTVGDSTQLVATTAFVDRAISSIDYSGFLEFSDTTLIIATKNDISALDEPSILRFSDTTLTLATKHDITLLDEPSLVRFSDTSSVIATKYDLDTMHHIGQTLLVDGDITLLNGSDRAITIPGSVGENLSIHAGAHLASGTAGSVYISGGSSLGTEGDVWIGYNSSSVEIGNGRAKTQAQGSNSTTLATTAYVDRMVPSITGNSGKWLTTNGSSTSWGLISGSDVVYGNGEWLLSTATTGDTVGVIRLNGNNTIELGATLNIGALNILPDAGLVTIASQGIPSLSYGSEAGYNLVIGGTQVFKTSLQADGTGSPIPGSINTEIEGNLDVSENLTVEDDIDITSGMITAPSSRFGQRVENRNRSVVVVDGDSRTAGYNGTGTLYPYSDQFVLDTSWLVYNTGVGGATMTYFPGLEWKGDAAYENVDKKYNTVGINNIVVIWAGINDMYTNNVEYDITFKALKAYGENRRQKGWKVIVCTEINTTDAVLDDSRRQNYNTEIRNKWSSFADGICDLGAQVPFASATAHENTTYYVDKVHLTNRGYDSVALYVENAIDELLARNDAIVKSLVIQVFDPASSVSTLADAAQISIPYGLDGWKISKVSAHSYTNTGQYIQIQIRNSRNVEALPAAGDSIFSVPLYVMHAYYDSKSYYNPTSGNYVIKSDYATVQEGYVLSIDVTYPAASTRKGLDVRIDFTK